MSGMTIAYTAIETFDPSDGETWTNYVNWSGLDHLKELITLDGLLCPSLIDDLTEEDGRYIVHTELIYGMFYDLRYLLGRIQTDRKHQVIATMREPAACDICRFTDERFEFKGYDLIEDETCISALTNCGGFDLAFSRADISDCGLVAEYERACQIKEALVKHYPEEPHAHCALWAIWRMRFA
jgi:hypothetical protein